MDKKIIIVTGSSGRIGTSVVKRLGKNYPIVGFDLFKAIDASDQEELIPVDISSDESVRQAFAHIRKSYGTHIASVIHLAAYYSFEKAHSENYERITVQGTKRLLKALQDFEVEQFIFTSTMLVHAPTDPGKPMTENSPLAPKWDYPLSKVRTEEVIAELRGKIPVVILRVAGVYDDHCNSVPLSHQIQRVYEKDFQGFFFAGDPSHGSSFVHMEDLVDAIELAVEKREKLPPKEVFLIGEKVTLSYEEIQKRISELLYHKEMPLIRIPKWIAKMGSWILCHIPFKEKPFIHPWMINFSDDHYELDLSHAKKLLGFSPKHSLEETLPLMIEDLKKDPTAWYQRNHLHTSKRLSLTA